MVEGPEAGIPELKLFCKEEWAENYAEKNSIVLKKKGAENIYVPMNESIHCFKGLISIYK